jgi:chorismate mutase
VTRSNRSLRDVRAEIDRTDTALVELLAARASLVREAFAIKTADGIALTDEAREREIVERAVLSARARGLPHEETRELLAAILRFSRIVAGG